jgi:hypothetical protein
MLEFDPNFDQWPPNASGTHKNVYFKSDLVFKVLKPWYRSLWHQQQVGIDIAGKQFLAGLSYFRPHVPTFIDTITLGGKVIGYAEERIHGIDLINFPDGAPILSLSQISSFLDALWKFEADYPGTNIDEDDLQPHNLILDRSNENIVLLESRLVTNPSWPFSDEIESIKSDLITDYQLLT